MKVRCKYDALVPISKLKLDPKNRNSHPPEQVERLAQILDYQGWRYPVKVSNQTGVVRSGHGRIEAAKLNKWTEVPVNYQDYDSIEQEYADSIADNAIASWAELDLKGIHSDILDLGPELNLEHLGIKDFTLELPEPEGQGDPDEIPGLPEKSRVKLGDLFILGNHRLLCGDSTKKEDVERLMNGEKADMVFTDPPYGISIVSSASNSGGAKAMTGSIGQDGAKRILKPRIYKKVENDESPETAFKAIENFPECDWIIWGGNFFAHRLPQSTHWIVWNKNSVDGAGEGSFFSDAELAWTNSKKTSVVTYRHGWSGLFRNGPRNEELTKRVHPTQKPVGLFSEILGDYTKNENIILDPFLGSGSTLIACEKTNRKCYGCEIDPNYCSVILDRWEKFSGKTAVREDGVKWSEIKAVE